MPFSSACDIEMCVIISCQSTKLWILIGFVFYKVKFLDLMCYNVSSSMVVLNMFLNKRNTKFSDTF
ncbi:unnamed protein product [Boreogadus saida]